MNFFTLKYFVDTFENKSFSRAAQMNYVSQTAISQQIAKLEDELNVTFFDRTKKPIIPTLEAEIFYKDAKLMLSHHQTMLDNLELIKQKPVRFGYAMHAQANYLIQTFASIPTSFIDFPITFIPKESGSPIDSLINNQVDIVTAPYSDTKNLPSSFQRKLFYKGRHVLAINKKHPLATKETLSMHDLEENYLLVIKSAEKEVKDELALHTSNVDTSKVYFKACGENYSSLLLSVLLNEGVCFVPEYLSKDLYEDNLVFRSISDDNRSIKLAICWYDDHDERIKRTIHLLTNASEQP